MKLHIHNHIHNHKQERKCIKESIRKLLTKDDPEETEDADGYDVCLDPDQYEIDTDQRKCDQCYKRFSIRDLSGGTCDECERQVTHRKL